MKYTHKRKAFYATCIQWTPANTQLIIEILYRAGCDANIYGDELMLRWKDDWHKPSIEMMKHGYYVRLGEDDSVKVIPPEKFFYEAI